MKQLLQLIKPFREMRNMAALCLMMLLAVSNVWAADEVFSTCRFGASYNPGNTSYTGTFTVTNDSFTWTVGNGNNNNNGWTNGDGYGQVKFGRKTVASVGYITTDAAYSEAITKVELTIDAFTSGKINSIKLYTGTSTTSMTEAGSFAVAVGTQTVVLSTPASDLYYKIEFDCAEGSSNGLITVSKVAYYYSTGGNPVVVTPTFTPNGGSFLDSQEVSIACATDGATIYYTLDGSDPSTSSMEYTTPFTLTQTTTVKAIGVKADYDNSAVASAVFTKQIPMTVAEARTFIDGLNGATSSDDVYVIGTISQIDSYNGTYHSITYWISDDGTTTDQMEVYSGKGLNGADFSAVSDLTLGSEVIVKGKVKLYYSTYEFTQNSQIVSLTLPSTPYIDADDVELAYDAVSGEIEYTLNNPVANGSFSVSENIDWISNAVINSSESKVTFDCEANPNAGSRSGVVTITYTYGDNTVSKEVIVTQTGNPDVIDNISDITAVGTAYSVRGTVVATNNKGFIMGDGTGYVYYYNNGAVSQSVGDMVKVSGTTGTYGQIIQFTNTATVTEATSSNYDNTPAATLITEVPDYSQGYHLSTYLEYEGVLTKDNNNNYLITVGESQIQISYPTSAQGTALTALVNKTVHVKGYFSGINSSSRFTTMLESAEEVVSSEPSITVEPTVVNVPAAAAEGTLTVTYSNIETGLGAEINWYEADGETPATYDWVLADFNEDNNIEYIIDANLGEARTAYMKVYAMDTEGGDVYSDLITFSQGHYIPDYATLPFAFDGGRADISNTAGLTQNGLGTDYSNSPKLKFDSQDDWLVLHFDETPGALTFDIKGNSFSGGTFTVQTSADGETYADLASYTELGAMQHEEFPILGSEVRYIKWIYTARSSGNVALGNISLALPSSAPVLILEPEEVSVSAEATEGVLTMTYQNMGEGPLFEVQYVAEDGGSATYDWIVADVNAENNVEYIIDANDGDARTAYLKVYGLTDDGDDVYSNVVAFTQAAYVAPALPGEWVLTSLADLTASDVFVIVGTYEDAEHDSYAMSNNNGTQKAPAAVGVTVVDNTLSGVIADTIQWNISVTDNGYIFYPKDSTTTWLYCTNTNNGVRVGINDANVFVLDAETGYLKHVATGRYLGIYNTSDWRCYTNTTGNIVNQTFTFYKKSTSSPECEKIVLNESNNYIWDEDFEVMGAGITEPFTGVEPECWTLVAQYSGAAMNQIGNGTDTLPQVFYNPAFDAAGGNYTLRFKFHSLLAMPELDESVELSRLHMSMYVRQPQSYYKLQVGILEDLEDDSTFEPLFVVDNESTNMEYFECDFSRYTGTGRYIAFKNVGGSSSNPYCSNYLDYITLTYNPVVTCGIEDPSDYQEGFEGYATNVGASGVEPDCWEVIHEDVALDATTKPQVYAGFNTTTGGNYTLRMRNRCVYAMPEFAEDVDITALTMTFNLRQPKAVYRLQVGVVDTNGNFEMVEELNNATADMEPVTVDFSGYTGNGHRIAFRNVLNGKHYPYSYNYIDDIAFGTSAKSVEATNDVNDAMDNERYLANISVYPNPTTGLLQIDAVDVQKVECYNQMGKLVGVYDNVNELNISELANGVYMLRITVPQGVTMRKVVKR